MQKGMWVLVMAGAMALGVAGTAIAKPPLYEPARLAIAGVALGMRPTEVAGMLTAAGYRRTQRISTQSWEEKIASEVAFDRGLPRPKFSESGVWRENYAKGQEEIEVTYRQSPGGPVVDDVQYRVPAATISADSFRAAVVSRYGPPSAGGESETVYCTVGEPACTTMDFPEVKQLPSISVSIVGGTRSLHLVAGARAWKEHEGAYKAEVSRRMPALRATF